jgi:hypothetical protein
MRALSGVGLDRFPAKRAEAAGWIGSHIIRWLTLELGRAAKRRRLQRFVGRHEPKQAVVYLDHRR